jgi:hypothetical protein
MNEIEELIAASEEPAQPELELEEPLAESEAVKLNIADGTYSPAEGDSDMEIEPENTEPAVGVVTGTESDPA